MKQNKAMTQKEIEAMIISAIEAARDEGRREAEQAPKDAYRMTERRLYALPDLRARVADDDYGYRCRSTDMVKYSRRGRVSEVEAEEMWEKETDAARARDLQEIRVLDAALNTISNDYYYKTVTGKYFRGLTEVEVAQELNCDSATVFRNRKRLVRKIAIRLYGVNAVY